MGILALVIGILCLFNGDFFWGLGSIFVALLVVVNTKQSEDHSSIKGIAKKTAINTATGFTIGYLIGKGSSMSGASESDEKNKTN